MTDTRYLLATDDAGADAETTRLALMEQIYDPGTTHRLTALGLAEGARCLEVGAGRGSIARWLAGRVGPSGQVVAADIDCRFLHALPANVEVRRLDITTDELEPDSYDLVHCRAVLSHLSDPLAALRRMAAAVRPGGLLLAEESEFAPLAFAGHQDSEWATEVSQRAFAGLATAKIANPFLGRDLARYLGEAGLAVLGGEMHGEISRCGEPWSRWWAPTMEAFVPGLVGSGLLAADEATRLLEVCRAPETVLTSVVVVSVWGRREP